MAPSFKAVNQRIEEEKRAKFYGTASLRLSALEYRNPRRDGAGGSTRNIDAIERIFRQENGCRKEDSRHHAKAVISPQMLEAALRIAGISGEKLMSDALPFYKLEFDPGIQIKCIEGHDRLAAADNVLYGSKTRWIVDLYLNDISDDLRLLLSDGFDYQKPPDDGTYYVTIRSFQGHHGEKNRFFENLWLGRLTTNANKRDLFDQLSTDKILCSSFNELLEIPALFGGFWLGSIHHLIRMKCPKLHRSYLNHTFKWWHDICGGEQAAMRLITREDVEALEGKAPGACAADARSLFSQVMGGEVFGNFTRSRREEIWSLVCSSSQRCLIPSLTTFFNDHKLLHDAIDSIRKILDFRYKPTLNSSLQEAFKDADQRQDRCIIQLSETTFGSVAGDAELRKHLAIRQIWLAAIRNYTELPAEPQKSSTMALSRSQSNITTLKVLRQPALREILQQVKDAAKCTQNIQNDITIIKNSVRLSTTPLNASNFSGTRTRGAPMSWAQVAAQGRGSPPLPPPVSHDTTANKDQTTVTAYKDRTVTVKLKDNGIIQRHRTRPASWTKQQVETAVRTSSATTSIKIVAAHQLKSGDIQIIANTTAEAKRLKENQEWIRSLGENAELIVPTYGVIVHGIPTNSLNIKDQGTTIQQILADNHTVIPSARISYIGWLTKEAHLKRASSIVVEFIEPEMANAIIYARMSAIDPQLTTTEEATADTPARYPEQGVLGFSTQEADNWLQRIDLDNWVDEAEEDEPSPLTSMVTDTRTAQGQIYKACNYPEHQEIYSNWPTENAELTIARYIKTCIYYGKDFEVAADLRKHIRRKNADADKPIHLWNVYNEVGTATLSTLAEAVSKLDQDHESVILSDFNLHHPL
ncbi:hypothetical protein ARSEF1564_009766 [Beauveria bassiana]